MSTEKTFNPDWEYKFWFYKHKFQWIMEMLDLVFDYEFADGEIEGMLLALAKTEGKQRDPFVGGLHYGKNGTMYLHLELDAENNDIVHLLISTNQKFESQIKLIDLLQCTYEGFTKFRTH